MPIDFNRQMIFDPKIDIIGKEVPLAEIEKTGNVLQGRYDQSYDNFTKFQQFAKKAQESADPVEREMVKQWTDSLDPQVKQISQNKDFHNMRFQTMALANDAADKYKTFADRAAQAKELRQNIALSKDLSKDETKQYYLDNINKQLKNTKYDPSTGLFDFTPITPPKMTADADVNASYNKYASGWLADRYSGESANMSFVKRGESIPGVGGSAALDGVYNTKTGHMVEKVDPKQVENGIKQMMKQDLPIQAMIDRDTEIYLSKHPEADPLKVRSEIENNTLNSAGKAWANKVSYTHDIRTEDVKYDGDASANYGGGAAELFNPNNLIGIPNEIAVDKQVQAIDKETTSMNSEAFNKDGSFKAVPPTMLDKVAKNFEEDLASGQLYLTSYERRGREEFVKKHRAESANSFDVLVPKYYQDMNKNLTQQAMYNKFQSEKRNSAKVLMTEYVIADKGRREVVDDNVQALLKNTPFYKDNGDAASPADIAAAWKSGGITMVPYTGEIKIGTGDIGLKSAIGNVGGKGNENNYAQIRMKAVQNVVNGLLDPTKPTTYGDTEIPIQDNNGNTLGVQRFVVNKQGARLIPKKVDGKTVYVPSPGRVSVIVAEPSGVDANGKTIYGNIKGKKDYELGDGSNPTTFVVDMLNEVVDPHILK